MVACGGTADADRRTATISSNAFDPERLSRFVGRNKRSALRRLTGSAGFVSLQAARLSPGDRAGEFHVIDEFGEA